MTTRAHGALRRNCSLLVVVRAAGAILATAAALVALLSQASSSAARTVSAPILAACGTAASLVWNPSSTSTYQDTQFTVPIYVNVAGGGQADVADVAFAWNTTYLTVVDITPGSHFPDELIKSIGAGAARFAAGALTGAAPAGSIHAATVTFRSLGQLVTNTPLTWGTITVGCSGDPLSVSTSTGAVSIIARSFALQLTPGWNLISSPLAPAAPAVTDVLSSIHGAYDLVYAYRAEDTADPWKKHNVAAPDFLNDLKVISESMGIWISIPGAVTVTLTLTGTQPLSPSIALLPGWNLAGYPSQTTRPVTAALSSCAGAYDLVYAYQAADALDPWKKYNSAAPDFLNDLKEMAPGRGYWINATAPCVWSTP